MATTQQPYLVGISSDLAVEIEDEFEGIKEALNLQACSFCTRCGAIVYRRDLHDAFHQRVSVGNALGGLLG